jgi:hypothetical protein
MEWYMPVIPALRRLKPKDLEFETTLGYIARPCPKSLKSCVNPIAINYLQM